MTVPSQGADDVQEPLDTKPESATKLDEIITSLENKMDQYKEKVRLISHLNMTDKFKLLSKQSRNNLIHGLLDDMSDLEELTKVTFRSLKKVKRERVPEDLVDEMLGVPESIRKAERAKDDFDQQPFGSNLEA